MESRTFSAGARFGATLGVVAFMESFAVAAPPSGDFALTFSDEFDGTTPTLSQWVRRYKWGEAVINGELEAYIDDAFTEQGGILSIVGKHEQGQYAGQTLDYTSGVLCSVHEQRYGYFEARLKVPKGQGYWPAFWLLGANGTTGVNEIDIHEILGNDPSTAYMTVHWGPSYTTGHQSDGSQFTGPDFSADFHTFGLEWDPDKIVWSIDGVERKTHTGAGVPQVDMYIILNLAIGGGWPGTPDSTTTFPGNYDIDYVRAYQRSADAGVDAGAGDASSGGASSGGVSNGGASGATADASAGGGASTRDSGARGSSSGGTSSASGGAAPSTSGGTSAGGASSNGGQVAAGSSVTPDAGTSAAQGESSGCGCRVEQSSVAASPISAALAVLVLLRRLRRDRS